MSTEVRHGHDPARFTASINLDSEFACTIAGYYTDTPDLGAAGVKYFVFHSDRPAKQLAELLILRTAFLEWFREQCTHLGENPEKITAHVQRVLDSWQERQS